MEDARDEDETKGGGESRVAHSRRERGEETAPSPGTPRGRGSWDRQGQTKQSGKDRLTERRRDAKVGKRARGPPLGDEREVCGRRPGDAEGEGKERVAGGSRGSETRSWNP